MIENKVCHTCWSLQKVKFTAVPTGYNETWNESGVDPGFSLGGMPTLQGAPKYDFATISKIMHRSTNMNLCYYF